MRDPWLTERPMTPSDAPAMGMVEIVERAIAEADNPAGTAYKLLARAAIAAMRDPTEAMISAAAGHIAFDDVFAERQAAARAWQAAIAAALREPTDAT